MMVRGITLLLTVKWYAFRNMTFVEVVHERLKNKRQNTLFINCTTGEEWTFDKVIIFYNLCRPFCYIYNLYSLTNIVIKLRIIFMILGFVKEIPSLCFLRIVPNIWLFGSDYQKLASLLH